MNELQELLAGWLSGLVMVLPVGYAFGAGMIAAVNPCGFAMLPAYLSLYLGAKEDQFAKRSPAVRMLRALLVGATVSLGFIFLFGLAGIVISAGGNALLGVMPTLAILIGAALILLGLWTLAGRGLYFGVFERFAGRVGDPTDVSVRGFFLFGLAYGAASLSCTLPVFLVVVGGGISAGGSLAGAGQFLGYSLGMASVLVALTLALALFKGSIVARIKRAVPYAQLASAVLLVLAGAYMIFYWSSSNGGAPPG
ncbi:MAG: Cytochrome c-type biogenesis protein CcdA (DsbD analog) [uncultured Rubrobacteraceae bacterium]|uniref:Cytochrome c-type biogenesis protein CcdA (DsbD analog) n=1 Tax=uncultured Rubrobacteraceae bacterium TaxID=349277 RepID=A0A6J4QBR8_9ACTN|nr:MAG: Cytochrome c-type biogenesis protein CcdA (DsbD analog) [uncultured Rubrobacteraceae bacterium]